MVAVAGPATTKHASKHARIQQTLKDYIQLKDVNWFFKGWQQSAREYLEGEFATLNAEDEAKVSASVLTFCEQELWTVGSMVGVTNGSSLRKELEDIANEIARTPIELTNPSPLTSDDDGESDDEHADNAAETKADAGAEVEATADEHSGDHESPPPAPHVAEARPPAVTFSPGAALRAVRKGLKHPSNAVDAARMQREIEKQMAALGLDPKTGKPPTP